MITCQNCGKTNEPTRKFCIRCGKSLLRPVKEKAEKPTTQVPELGTVTTAAKLKAAAEAKRTREAPSVPATTTTDDRWVRPSSVSRDRVRATGTRTGRSESEKAREIFEKSMEYGIDETGTGIVETRMLRASEVKSLLESPDAQEPLEPARVPTSPSPDWPVESAPDEEARVVAPPPARPASAEQRLLGSKSAYVRGAEELSTEQKASVPDTSEFTSSRYADEGISDVPAPMQETAAPVPKESEEELAFEDLSTVVKPASATAKPVPVAPRAARSAATTAEFTAVCPSCGGVVHVDSFEYPREIYSVMAEARLKQARFFVVQGKYDEAKRIIAIAVALFEKAEDENGKAQADKLLRSLSRS